MDINVKNYCIECDGMTWFDTREDADGFYSCFCKSCGSEVYVPELNDFNARLAEVKRARTRNRSTCSSDLP